MTDTRIGPAMQHAVRYVHEIGGVASCALVVAEAVGPNGSRKYGYQTVDRCIRAGLLAVDPNHPAASTHGSGAIVLTEAGLAVAVESSAVQS
jgi:hypothetical protein